MKTRILLKTSILYLFVIGAIPVSASTFVAMTEEELIRASDAVVQGRVIQLESRWDDQGRIIVTDATVQVSEYIIGDAPSQMVVQIPGGQVADFRVEAHGFPQLAKGQEVILFVRVDTSSQVSRIVGHQQGHFEVVKRLDGVTLAVPQVEDGVSFLTPSGRPLSPPASTELNIFKGRIRAEAVRIGKPVN